MSQIAKVEVPELKPELKQYNFVIYDVESFPNLFSLVAYDVGSGQIIKFEVSWRCNHLGALFSWIDYWVANHYHMVGFNSMGYDYPLLHELYTGFGYNNASDIYRINERLINTPYQLRHKNIIKPWEVLIRQIDLMKVHHFDNEAKQTSLKVLEFNMRSDDIRESEYPFGVPLPETNQAAESTLNYNVSDVMRTFDFFLHSQPELLFRFKMSEKHNKNFLNHSDSKFGKDYFVMHLENAGIPCYANGSVRQTLRGEISLGDCIFPYIHFNRPEFQKTLDQLKNTKIVETKGALKIKTLVDGFSFDFALGGIHGSVTGEKFISDDDYIITDADVTSFYPLLTIKNNVYPEHLSSDFCNVYFDLFQQRAHHKKVNKNGPEDKGLKISLNSVYGNSNSSFSPFFDSKYTMTTTINGQLLLCMLAENLMRIPNLRMIQINTDGLTVRLPRVYQEHYKAVCEWWEKLTCLNLEYVNYKSMIVRDVNNYIAVPFDGDPKFKGAYVHKGRHLPDSESDRLEWHKNHSALVVKKAVAAAVLEGVPVSKYIRTHDDIFDFFLLAKVGKKDKLELRKKLMWDGKALFDNVESKVVQNVSRYLVVNDGYTMIKTMPAIKRRTGNVQMLYPNWHSKKINSLNKNLKVTSEEEYNDAVVLGYVTKDGGTYDRGPEREFEIQKGWQVDVFNRVVHKDINLYDINYEYYIEQAEKLVDAALGVDYEAK